MWKIKKSHQDRIRCRGHEGVDADGAQQDLAFVEETTVSFHAVRWFSSAFRKEDGSWK